MRATVESTREIVRVNGAECRVWTGKTEAGIPFKLYVHRVQVLDTLRLDEFERDLLPKPRPPELPAEGPVAVDLRKVL